MWTAGLCVMLTVCAVTASLTGAWGDAYKKGASGATVTEIQTRLKNWGYYSGEVDGVFGSATEKAVKYFQQKNGLTADGVVGAQTLAALGIQAMRGRIRRLVMSLTNIPLVNPEIVSGISLALLFVLVGRVMLSTEDILGFTTLLIAHVTFCLPYVILSVMPKLRQLDPSLMDAAQDLGCTPAQGFFKVVLPELLPGIISGAIMAFTMSLDDFVISYFVYGPKFATLPVEIYTYTRKQVPPSLYAMFTLMFFLILIVMAAMNIIQARDERKQKKRIKNA